MILKDISFPSPQENILFDEVLLALAEKGDVDGSLRFWEAAGPFIVLGRISKPQEDINVPEALRHRIPVVRRCSGGGTVVQGKGCLNYSLVLSKKNNPHLADLKRSYQFISQKIISALKKLGIEAQYFPTSDIALAGTQKKFSGNAQKRCKHFILHHGTILYAFDLGLINRFLMMPQSVPPYRAGRTHEDFVTNINCDVHSLKREIADAFGAQRKVDPFGEKEKDLLAEFLQTKNVTVNLSH